MILFYSSKQNNSNKSFYKGLLFEDLLKNYLSKNGYEVNLERIKENSLEYDIKGVSKIQNIQVIGEAKAHESPISGAIFTSFVGKLLPLGIVEKKISGLFLSISSLTPEASNYLKSISNYNIKSITGKELQLVIEDALGIMKQETLKSKIEDLGYDPQLVHILHTDNTTYSVITAGSRDRAEAAFFAIFQKNGQHVTDKIFISKLQEHVTELSSLEYIYPNERFENNTTRIINRGLVVGDSVFEYRLPAAPEFFVGRKEFTNNITNYINNPKNTNILQIKSRSGVGKSSTLAYLEKKFKSENCLVELHDARDVKSELDIFSLIKRFCNQKNIPEDFLDIQSQLKQLVITLNNQKAVFIIDQFESTFNKLDVFLCYQNIAKLFLEHKEKLIFILARKNDQITTYDENQISLDYLNTISKSFILEDFSVQETIELLSKIRDEVNVRITSEVLAYIKEFSQGFPWLIKRMMSHLIYLINSGATQSELIASGLKLDDLFNEEIEILDELEKSYLYKIAARLPADYNQLSRIFDEDPLLTKVLDTLTKNRLIRLTGSTYDTYNDVFKEYLVYKKLPEFKYSYIYRQFPSPILTTFHNWIVKKDKFTIEDFEKEASVSKGSAFNQIRELTNINFITKQGIHWIVPKVVNNMYKQGRLGEYLRHQLLNNDIVSKFINKILQQSISNNEEITIFLQKEFPFIEANEKTWNYYTNVFLAWLNTALLIDYTDDGLIVRNKDPHNKIVIELGNLKDVKSSKKRSPGLEIFLPSVTFNQAMEVFDALSAGNKIKNRSHTKAISDFKVLNILRRDKIQVNSKEDFKSIARSALEIDTFNEFWKAVLEKSNVKEIFMRDIQNNLTSETLKWRIKLLINWGKELAIIPDGRYKYK